MSSPAAGPSLTVSETRRPFSLSHLLGGAFERERDELAGELAHGNDKAGDDLARESEYDPDQKGMEVLEEECRTLKRPRPP
ncbi:hypothetical protein H0H92_002919, partial [Tricholoma furcatifolium]